MKKEKCKKLLQLVSNWRKQFFTYSFWLNIASIVLTAANIVLPFMGLLQPVLSIEVYGWSMFLLNVAAATSKFIKQEELVKKEKEDDQDSTV